MNEQMVNVLNGHGYVRLVDHNGSDLSVANAARVSFDKESEELTKKDEGLIKFLLREGHESPFRHAAISYEIYAPLMVARQWWKYVVASSHVDDQIGHNESSRRYVTEDPTFYVPGVNEWRSAPENSKQGSGEPVPVGIGNSFTTLLREHAEKGEELYERAMEAGVCTEQARLFLPAYALYVRWRWFISLQGVLHFLDQRLADDAQVEIQQYAKAVHELTEPLYPVTFREALK